jgi:protoporphyrinogen/coproporphyrinogen III oxidase
MPTVVIVGGGISGLSLAYRLQQAAPSYQIVVLERDSRFGGTVGTERRDGFLVETGPNGFLDNKPFTLGLSNDLGLTDHLVPASEAAARNRFLFLDNKLRALPTSLFAFLRSDLLSWRGKLKVGAERFRSSKRSAGDESVADFFRRRIGREATEKLADAFVTGIYAGDPELLSLRASFPRLADMERQYGSLLRGMAALARKRRREADAAGKPANRGNRMWSFRGGLSVLIERLRLRLQCPPIPNVRICGIKQDAECQSLGKRRWIIRAERNAVWEADAVVLTCPAYEQAAILSELDGALAEDIGGIPYVRVAVVALGYRRQDVPGALDGFGFLVPQRDRRDLLGVQWCSTIFPDRAPSGSVLLRAMCGGWHRGEMVDWDDGRLFKAVESELRQTMGIQSKPIFQQVIRWQRAIPQYLCGHLDRVERIENRAAGFPGLFLGGNCYRGVALNDCVEQGTLLAQRIGRYLGSGAT